MSSSDEGAGIAAGDSGPLPGPTHPPPARRRPPLTVRLAQITDIHLSLHDVGESMVLRAEAPRLLAGAVAACNAAPDLDVVLVTGDLIDNGTPAELDAVIATLSGLRVPWYAIPGNHDIAYPPDSGRLDRRQFYSRLQAAAPDGATVYAAAPESGCWTVLLKPGVRLIGLDSNIPGDWGGQVDAGQLAWLAATLTAAAEPLIVLAVHHPLHEVFGGWAVPAFAGQDWHKFFCVNGPEVTALLDRYPAVRVVLTGHDHVSAVAGPPGRVHISSPALASYPLAYRTVEVRETGAGWEVAWATGDPADTATHEQARARLEATVLAESFDPANPHRFAALSAGRPEDQQGRRALVIAP